MPKFYLQALYNSMYRYDFIILFLVGKGMFIAAAFFKMWPNLFTYILTSIHTSYVATALGIGEPLRANTINWWSHITPEVRWLMVEKKDCHMIIYISYKLVQFWLIHDKCKLRAARYCTWNVCVQVFHILSYILLSQ